MRTRTDSQTRLGLGMAIALCATLLGVGRVVADDASGAGMRVYRDPATGVFTSPPPGTSVPPTARALGTAAQSLVETPGTSAAGGVTIDLGDRFQSAVVGAVGGDGTVRTQCHSDDPGDAAR
jgi:hypothetical protein